MRFSVEKNEFNPVLNSVLSVVPQKSIKPVLEGVLFKVEDGNLTLEATDLETAIKIKDIQVNADGVAEFVVGAKMLTEIVNNLPSGEVVFEYTKPNLTIRARKSKFTLPTMSADDFPEIKSVRKGAWSIETSITALELMIDRTLFCAAKDVFIRNLNSVNWEFTSGKLRLVAADGFRMGLIEEKVIGSIEESFLLTLKSMKDIKSSFKNAKSDDIKIVYDGSRVGLYFNNTEMVVRVVDADFPDYERVIPKNIKTKIIVNKQEFIDAVRRASIVSKLSADSVKLSTKGNTMSIFARNENGEATEEIEAFKDGEDILIAFDPKFLIEAAKKIGSEKIELNFVDADSPLKMVPFDNDNYMYIIMPIRLA